MPRRPRRVQFQLVSLFDLLIIIVFAQYLENQQTGQQRLLQARQEVQAAELSARQAQTERLTTQTLVDRLQQAREQLAEKLTRAELRAQSAQQQSAQQRQDLVELQQELLQLGTLAARLFHIPPEQLTAALQARSPAESAKLREQLRQLTAGQGAQFLRHLLTWSELHKRCDVWDVQIDDDNLVHLTTGEHSTRVRAPSAERFQTELQRFFRTLPQPKSLVLIVISWSDADLATRQAVLGGVESAVRQLRDETDRRSRFEAAVLGFLPLVPAAASNPPP